MKTEPKHAQVTEEHEDLAISIFQLTERDWRPRIAIPSAAQLLADYVARKVKEATKPLIAALGGEQVDGTWLTVVRLAERDERLVQMEESLTALRDALAKVTEERDRLKEHVADSEAFRKLRGLISWPTVTEVYISPLIAFGSQSKWQVELCLAEGQTVAFSHESLNEAIALAEKARDLAEHGTEEKS